MSVVDNKIALGVARAGRDPRALFNRGCGSTAGRTEGMDQNDNQAA